MAVLHRGLEGTKVTMAAQWESAAVYEACAATPVLGYCLKRHLRPRSLILVYTKPCERSQLPSARSQPTLNSQVRRGGLQSAAPTRQSAIYR
jgi:hypothetical protein